MLSFTDECRVVLEILKEGKSALEQIQYLIQFEHLRLNLLRIYSDQIRGSGKASTENNFEAIAVQERLQIASSLREEWDRDYLSATKTCPVNAGFAELRSAIKSRKDAVLGLEQYLLVPRGVGGLYRRVYIHFTRYLMLLLYLKERHGLAVPKAVVYCDSFGNRFHYDGGLLHNLHGPAVSFVDGDEAYWLNGRRLAGKSHLSLATLAAFDRGHRVSSPSDSQVSPNRTDRRRSVAQPLASSPHPLIQALEEEVRYERLRLAGRHAEMKR